MQLEILIFFKRTKRTNFHCYICGESTKHNSYYMHYGKCDSCLDAIKAIPLTPEEKELVKKKLLKRLKTLRYIRKIYTCIPAQGSKEVSKKALYDHIHSTF